MNAPTFNLVFCDTNPDVISALIKLFDHHREVHIHLGTFQGLTIDWDCIVSPANSFGIMDGGIDKAIIDYFGIDFQHKVFGEIMDCWHGEQPVGTSMLIYHTNGKCVAHTPTMRMPRDIRGTANVYYAMKAMLKIVKNYNDLAILDDVQIKTVICPGLGTLTGKMPPMLAAQQMEHAYYDFKNPPDLIDWSTAAKHDAQIAKFENNQPNQKEVL